MIHDHTNVKKHNDQASAAFDQIEYIFTNYRTSSCHQLLIFCLFVYSQIFVNFLKKILGILFFLFFLKKSRYMQDFEFF